MTQTINLNLKGIVYNDGTTEIECYTNRQWAAKKISKKFKQSTVTVTNLASIHIKIKTK